MAQRARNVGEISEEVADDRVRSVAILLIEPGAPSVRAGLIGAGVLQDLADFQRGLPAPHFEWRYVLRMRGSCGLNELRQAPVDFQNDGGLCSHAAEIAIPGPPPSSMLRTVGPGWILQK